MRSRYCAYVKQLDKYVHRTWHPSTRPHRKSLKSTRDLEWLGLQILHCHAGAAKDDQGTVEFIAHYREKGEEGQIHEISEFKRTRKGWVYVSGVHRR